MKKLTKNAILLSFEDMLERMPFDKITVSALVKECGINHNTFYYHYHDIYQLLNEWITQKLGNYAQNGTADDLEEGIKALLRSCQLHRKTIYHIFDSLSRDHLERYLFSCADDILYRFICRQANGKEIAEDQLQNMTSFCHYALTGFFLRFLWDDMQADAEQSVNALSPMFRGLIAQSIEQFSTSEPIPPGTNQE